MNGSSLSTTVVLAIAFLATSCSSTPRPEGAARPEESWVAATCLPAAPDTAGWTVHEFSDRLLAVPADFNVRNRTTRSIEFVYLGSVLGLRVSTSPTPEIFYAPGRPALAREEAGCTSRVGGYPGLLKATARANRFQVDAEWEGSALWGGNDWRKRLFARITTGSLEDAQRLRDALHTLRVSDKR
jgi:hypothetical protein